MDWILSFFSDLILFTAGLVVLVLWLVFFVATIIEISDAYRERNSKEDI